jgi:CheY-like chemotaxis protein
MATKRVLSVGQCAMDHGNISRMLTGHFQAEVVPADTAEEALDLVRGGGFDLVLVNRVFDSNGGSGLDLIRRLKAGGQAPPVMLVSNYEDAQKEAVAAGALPGFGKGALGTPATLGRLRAALGA